MYCCALCLCLELFHPKILNCNCFRLHNQAVLNEHVNEPLNFVEFFLRWKLHCQMTVFTESYFVKCNIKSKGIFCSLKTTMGKGFTNFKSIWQQLLNITIENSQNIKCTKPTLPWKGILTLITKCKYIDHHNNKAPPFIQWSSMMVQGKGKIMYLLSARFRHNFICNKWKQETFMSFCIK